MTRYRRIPLSPERLRHYERMHFHVTRKPFGEYTDRDIDIASHCDDIRVPCFMIHQPRRFCSIDLDWQRAVGDLTLPAQYQLTKWANQMLEASPAPAARKSVQLKPGWAIVRGVELEQAQAFCQHVWEWLLEPPSPIEPEGKTA